VLDDEGVGIWMVVVALLLEGENGIMTLPPRVFPVFQSVLDVTAFEIF
jgi:hypothetical protein